MAIFNQKALNERANNLGTLNGLQQVLVSLHPQPDPTEAHLEVYFFNENEIADILADPGEQKVIFPITGGHRLPAGPLERQVQVTAIAAGPNAASLILTVQPIGDYSTYTLGINFLNIDPIFSEIDFKFRPGCFSIDCAPDWQPAPAPKEDPLIDYLAKDYESFRHTLISAMMERVPGWQPSSEADLDQMIIEIFSAAADELSDYQDRVMNEAYLATARKRVSLARLARLVDYHIHQGNHASSWLAVEVVSDVDFYLSGDFLVWSGNEEMDEASIVFALQSTQRLHHLLNRISLYTWSDAIPALAAGSTTADLKFSDTTQATAEDARDLFLSGDFKYLLIQEWLNPATGQEADRDPGKRQLLTLVLDDSNNPVEALQDPHTGDWFVRVHWQEPLAPNFCFTVACTDAPVVDVSLFHGNLLEIAHGFLLRTIFAEPGTLLTTDNQAYYERTGRWGALCRIPEIPLAYKNTEPGGDTFPLSTLEIEVEAPGGPPDQWDEVISLIHSDDGDESGDHFIVETDEEQNSLIRFGNGVNGKELPENAIVHCKYQVGQGIAGNIGGDTLIRFDTAGFPDIETCWNPFDITNGREPESVGEIIRRVPEAYRYRQLRAVTLQDYVNRAEELPEVSRAAARYAWTGSWRAVRIAIDPAGTDKLSVELRKTVARHLDAVRLIGEDLEIRPPRFVPMEIYVSLCVHSDFWPEDIRLLLEQEFSDGYTPDGRLAFFHPDRWTFGQELRASQIIGPVQAIVGVDHVISVTMKRWNEPTPGGAGILELETNEVIQVKNDPDHMEKGFIIFDVKGDRR